MKNKMLRKSKNVDKAFMDRLAPFIYRKSARQRIFLYLVSIGYNFEDLSKLTVADLKTISFPEDNDLCLSQNQLLSTLKDDEFLFTYPNGRKMGQSDFFRILTQASASVLGRSITVDEFKIYLNNNT